MTKITKKSLFKTCLLGLLLACTCLFTSCIDYVQSIKFDENGYESYLKIAISKTVMELSGETPDSILGDLEGIEDELPRGCEINKINNPFEVGFDFRYKINGFTNPQDAQLFQPYLSEDQKDLMIPFILGQEFDDAFSTGDAESQAMMDTYLSTAKCRFLISKSVVEKMEGACFYGDTTYLEIPFYDYGDSWCLEIPMSFFNFGDEIDLSVIAVQGF